MFEKYISNDDIEDFRCGIDNGYLMWKCKLFNNETLYQIKYRIEEHITPKGNKSKRKVYFINVNDEKLIFDDELKKRFRSFTIPYIRGGI